MKILYLLIIFSVVIVTISIEHFVCILFPFVLAADFQLFIWYQC